VDCSLGVYFMNVGHLDTLGDFKAGIGVWCRFLCLPKAQNTMSGVDPGVYATPG
jgi:hypothetical protein